MSNTIPVTVTFECQKCGGTKLSLPDDYSDDSIASCANCGTALGRWGDIRQAAAHKITENVADSLRNTLRDAFKGSKHIKFQ